MDYCRNLASQGEVGILCDIKDVLESLGRVGWMT